MTTLGANIKHYRTLKGWNQTKVAEQLKMTTGAYAKIERDETDAPYSRIQQIAKVFGITVIDLLSQGKSKNQWEKIVSEKDKEIMNLQKKIIQLLEKKK